MSDVSAVTNLLLTANEGFTSTVGVTGVVSGGATVPLTNVSGLTNGSVFVGIIEPGLTNQQVFTGTVDTAGNQVTGVKWTRGNNVAHAAGVSVVDYSTGTAINMITKALAAHANQDGTLKNNAVTTPVVADNAITTSKIVNANVTSAKLATTAVTPSVTDWSTFSLNMKAATNGSLINIANNAGGQDLNSNGVGVTFTVASNCNAFVTMSIGLNATADIEFQPRIYLDGSQAAQLLPNAATGIASNRASVRGFTAVIPLTTGAHTLSAGIFTMNGGACTISAGAATISAIVLGKVTA